MIYGGYFEPDKKLARKSELENIMNSSGFWDDKKKSESVISELNSIKAILDRCSSLKNKIDSDIEIIDMLGHDFDSEMYDVIMMYDALL